MVQTSHTFTEYFQVHLTRFLIILISLTFSTLWIQIEDRPDQVHPIDQLGEPDNDYEIESETGDNTKYILLWKPDAYGPFSCKNQGRQVFIKSKCLVSNCFTTTDKNFLGGDLSRFHALAFSGNHLNGLTRKQLPKRWAHQKYIFYNLESGDNYPVCHRMFDDLFNWTVTYRLNSDIPNPYVLIKDSKGNIIGPHPEMKWTTKAVGIKQEILDKIKKKSKAIAWFVSNCYSKIKRKIIYKALQKALNKYRLKVDIYGACGTLKCPKDDHNKCAEMLETDYYFYLSWENSLDEDYVTEKLLTAVQHQVVPIVLGGANYSRFLPPGSYLHALAQPMDVLAKKINFLINNPDEYRKYFHWTSHYSYHDPANSENVCAICEALHSDKYYQISTYKQFRKWWNPRFKQQCMDEISKIKTNWTECLKTKLTHLYKNHLRKKLKK